MEKIPQFDFAGARERLQSVLQSTSLLYSPYFSEKTGNEVYLKPENLQTTGSFKIRGAYNKISKLSREEQQRGLVTASAGNHAQGVAYAARELGVPATIVMPEATPYIKVERTKRYGVDVVLKGENFDAAYAHCLSLVESTGATLVHPFDDLDVIEGQGTIALEIFDDVDPDCILVPVGGGGLISGVGVCAKEKKPAVEIIGVESTEVPSMQNAIVSGSRCMLPWARSTIADGTAVREPGKQTYSFACRCVDQWMDVSDFDLMTCFAEMMEQHKLVVEPSGLLSIAAAKNLPAQGKKVVCVLSGGNIDMLTISNIVSRGLVSKGRIFTLHTEVENRPGVMANLLQVLAKQRANIIKIDHDAYRNAFTVNTIDVSVTAETNGFEHIENIKKALEEAGFQLKSE